MSQTHIQAAAQLLLDVESKPSIPTDVAAYIASLANAHAQIATALALEAILDEMRHK